MGRVGFGTLSDSSLISSIPIIQLNWILDKNNILHSVVYFLVYIYALLPSMPNTVK